MNVDVLVDHGCLGWCPINGPLGRGPVVAARGRVAVGGRGVAPAKRRGLGGRGRQGEAAKA